MMSVVDQPQRRASSTSGNSIPLSYEQQFEQRQTQKRRGVLSKVSKYLHDQAQQNHSYASQHLTPDLRGSDLQRVPWGGTRRLETEELRERLYATVTVLDRPAFLDDSSCRSARPWVPKSRTNSMMDATGIHMKRFQYANNNILQSYDVYVPERENVSSTKEDKLWIVYIHGGYFRDVKVDSTSLRKTISVLEGTSPDLENTSSADSQAPSLTESDDTYETAAEVDAKTASVRDRIAGYASINYRLSPHPAYPQDPSRTPSYELRTARWPEQMTDVVSALKHLQNKFSFGSNYVLVGHSVGATLAFLATLKCSKNSVPPPRALVGISGIYDFPQIHKAHPDYVGMTANAMDAKYFAEASPACYELAKYADAWKVDGVRQVLLAHSKDDGLVDWSQVERMQDVLAGGEKQNIDTNLLELFGVHNDIWVEGKECARAIKYAVDKLQ